MCECTCRLWLAAMAPSPSSKACEQVGMKRGTTLAMMRLERLPCSQHTQPHHTCDMAWHGTPKEEGGQ